MKIIKKLCIFECLGCIVFFSEVPEDAKGGLIAVGIFCALVAFLLLKKPKNAINQAEEQTNTDTITENTNVSNTSRQRRNQYTNNKVPKIILGTFCIFIVAVICAGIAVPKDTTSTSISLFSRELELNQEQKTAMIDIFTQCGIGEITNVNPIQHGETQSSYWLTDNETEFYGKGGNNAIVVWVDNETKAINEIYFHDQDIYVNGEVIAPITQYYVKEEDRNNYRVIAELTITPLLNFPKTAKYPASRGWQFDIEDDIVTANSSVEAENALGVKIETPFQIKFSGENVIYLNLGGTEYIK